MKLELLPVVFPLHMVTGGLALLLVPLVLFLRGTRWHKLVGRVAAIDILIAGVTAIPVADVVETWKWRGVPVWKKDGIICTGETYKAVVKLTL